jgi:hypothetical protein
VELERPLPQNADAERAVLGAILLGHSPGSLSIRAGQFFVSEHAVIFRCIRAMFAERTPIDLVTLADALRRKGQLEAAGGGGYLSSLVDGVPRVSNVAHYERIVIQDFQLRQRAYTAQRVLDLVLGANGDAAEALKEIGMLSAHLKEEVGQDRILKFRTGAEIAMANDKKVEWIVPGFVAKGGITELGAKVKIGKTTLVLNLVHAVADGSEFLGNPTLRTPTVYLTEQPMVSFRQAMERAGLLGREDFHVLQYIETRGMPWQGVVAEAIRECKRVGAMLLVIDTLPQFAGLKGDSENNSGDALAAMEPLLQAAAEGIGIVLVRHERKSGGDVGDSGRGSSAFAGAVDIVLSLRKPEGNAKKTQRVLHALSRFSETRDGILIELTEGGYVSLGGIEMAALKAAKDSILAIAPESELEAMDLKELAESAEVPRATAQRAVKEQEGEGDLVKVGKGKRGDPYRYFRPKKRSCPTSDIGGQKESGEGSSGEASA